MQHARYKEMVSNIITSQSQTISALSTLNNRSEKKFANYFIKSVYVHGGLYIVTRARDRTDLFWISVSVTLSTSISNELNLYPVFWVTLRISLFSMPPFGECSKKSKFRDVVANVWLVQGILHDAKEQWARYLSGSRPHRDYVLTKTECSFRVWVSLFPACWPPSTKVALPYSFSSLSKVRRMKHQSHGAPHSALIHQCSHVRIRAPHSLSGSFLLWEGTEARQAWRYTS